MVAGNLPNGTAVYATILTYPFTAEGEVLTAAQRPNILARVSDFVNPVSSSAFTARQSALSNSTEEDLLARFVSAMYAANLYLHDPGKENCSKIAIEKQLNVSTTVAQLEYSAATAHDTGEVSPGGNFTVSETGLLNVIAVREEFDGFANLPSDYNFTAAIIPGKGQLIDYSIRDAAVAILQKDLLETTC